MGLSIKANIPSKYLLIISATVTISIIITLLYSPFSPVHLTMWGGEGYISPDSSFSEDFSYIGDLSITYDDDDSTYITSLDSQDGYITWNFSKPVDINSMKVKASTETRDGLTIGRVTLTSSSGTNDFVTMDDLVWGTTDDVKEYTFPSTQIGITSVKILITSAHSGSPQPNLYEVAFKGEVQTVTCFQCQNNQLVEDTIEGTSCPTDWYLYDDIPEDYCGVIPTPITGADIPYAFIILAIVVIIILILVIKRRF